MLAIVMVASLLSSTEAPKAIEGVASYYTVASSSEITASGEPFEDDELTCAMLHGEFGTYYRVTAANGESVIVRLNDRGPYVKGRLIDLSEAAIRELHPEAGLIRVKIEPIDLRALAALGGD